VDNEDQMLGWSLDPIKSQMFGHIQCKKMRDITKILLLL